MVAECLGKLIGVCANSGYQALFFSPAESLGMRLRARMVHTTQCTEQGWSHPLSTLLNTQSKDTCPLPHLLLSAQSKDGHTPSPHYSMHMPHLTQVHRARTRPLPRPCATPATQCTEQGWSHTLSTLLIHRARTRPFPHLLLSAQSKDGHTLSTLLNTHAPLATPATQCTEQEHGSRTLATPATQCTEQGWSRPLPHLLLSAQSKDGHTLSTLLIHRARTRPLPHLLLSAQSKDGHTPSATLLNTQSKDTPLATPATQCTEQGWSHPLSHYPATHQCTQSKDDHCQVTLPAPATQCIRARMVTPPLHTTFCSLHQCGTEQGSSHAPYATPAHSVHRARMVRCLNIPHYPATHSVHTEQGWSCPLAYTCYSAQCTEQG